MPAPGKTKEVALHLFNLAGKKTIMLPATPYYKDLNSFDLEVIELYIDPIGYIPDISTFKEYYASKVHIGGSWINKDSNKECSVRVEASIYPLLNTDARIMFVGNYRVKGNAVLPIPRVCELLVQYSWDIINQWIIDKPLKDKDGKLFIMPVCYNPADMFLNINFT